jgi:hypothetical protein
MASILSYGPIRELPICREGVSAGINIGTWQSLNVIVLNSPAKRTRPSS